MYSGEGIIKICWWHVRPEEKHGFVSFFKTGTCLYYHTQPGSRSWHTLVPVVVYSDWTMWLPCGCQAAPLLCGNWCLWYCRVAAVPWVTVLATCPALAAITVRRRWHRSVGGLCLSRGAGGAPAKYVIVKVLKQTHISSSVCWVMLLFWPVMWSMLPF